MSKFLVGNFLLILCLFIGWTTCGSSWKRMRLRRFLLPYFMLFAYLGCHNPQPEGLISDKTKEEHRAIAIQAAKNLPYANTEVDDSVYQRETWMPEALKVYEEVVKAVKEYPELAKTHGKVVKERDGKKQEVEIYDENGEVKIALRYFSDIGLLNEIAHFRNGKQNGWSSILYSKQGTPMVVYQWTDNNMDGDIYIFYKDGSLKSVGQIRMNYFLGAQVAWDEQGNVTAESKYMKSPKFILGGE